jgi:hypothetical protein
MLQLGNDLGLNWMHRSAYLQSHCKSLQDGAEFSYCSQET